MITITVGTDDEEAAVRAAHEDGRLHFGGHPFRLVRMDGGGAGRAIGGGGMSSVVTYGGPGTGVTAGGGAGGSGSDIRFPPADT